MPTYHRFAATKRSVESIIPHVESSTHDTTLYICDNNSPKEMVDWLESKNNDKVRLIKSNKNLGKAKIINEAYRTNNNCTHFISVDGDMVAEVGDNWIDGMVWCIDNFPKFGVLSAMQLENCHHNFKDTDQLEKIGNHEIIYGSYNQPAGGCIILKKEVWESIGCYKTIGNVYGWDDAVLMQDISRQGLLTGVIKTIGMIHPPDEDDSYKSWKYNNYKTRAMKGFYDG